MSITFTERMIVKEARVILYYISITFIERVIVKEAHVILNYRSITFTERMMVKEALRYCIILVSNTFRG